MKRYLGTISGIVLGSLAIVIWLLTYQPDPGYACVWELFPLSRRVFGLDGYSYLPISISLAAWFAVGFLQWLLAGVSVDWLRALFRFYQRSQANARTVRRCLALGGIGWAVVVPFFLFFQEYNDSEFTRLEALAYQLDYNNSKAYIGAKEITVPKRILDRNSAEISRLVDTRGRRFKEYTAAVTGSSAGVVILSVYFLRNAKKPAA